LTEADRILAKIGVVVIGRNEGERLRNCLVSIGKVACPLVYVDSGSSDDSVAIARSFNAEVVELDPGRPFSAARARNEGFAHLLEYWPVIRFVQFVDGDCTLLDGWLPAAAEALMEDPKRGAVLGHLRERNADASPYNRLCALEWKSQPGDLQNFGGFGGIAMIRSDVLRHLGGYNPDVIAGEDSELGVRMGLAGYKVTKIDHSMATHDANMTSFQQWWRRSVRAGHAIGQRAHLNGKTALRDCVRERNSTLFWGIALPGAIAVTALPSHGISLFALSAYLFLGYRVWRNRRNQGDSQSDALLYTRFLLLAKFANATGLLRFFVNRMFRRYEIIEYK
jgi:GT2 family glycosyltransferase